MRRRVLVQGIALGTAALLIWLVFVRAGLDFTISGLFYDAARREFPLRDAWMLAAVGHSGLKYAVLVLWGCIALLALLPPQALRRWQGAAAHAAAAMAATSLAVVALRAASAHSCPWDLAAFGGMAEWFPLFGAMPANPGPGRCLPAGHASTGFALFALYFALQDRHPVAARRALAGAVLIGIVASAVQVARGAHFASHALWTAWLSWALNLVIYLAFRSLKRA